jgi:peptidoglycan/LPS O-acetylase OafA/YrhL
LAALAVALHHSLLWLTIDGNRAIWFHSVFNTEGASARAARALLAICSGAAAVDVFFVLSGLVLALSLGKSSLNARTMAGFWSRRFFRIYPAYLVSLGLVCLYLQWRPQPGAGLGATSASYWLSTWFTEPITAQDVVLNAILYHLDLNHIAWTLRIELVLSLLFPGLYWICLRSGRIVNILLLVLSAGLLFLPILNPFHYVLMFIAGIHLARFGREIAAGLERFAGARLAMAGVSGAIVVQGLFWQHHEPASDLIIAVAATGLIALCGYSTDGRAFRFLDNPAVRYLGRISYSFYLLHFLALYVVASAVIHLADPMTLAAHPLAICGIVGLASVAATVPLAAVCYHGVERPFIRLGRAVASRV